MVVHVTPPAQHHDVLQSEPPKMGDILRISYLVTLPFFNTVALLTNILIFCIFSTSRMKKYRASVFLRYIALVDILHSTLTFGLQWLALALPEHSCSPAERYLHCRIYTVFRYTLQDGVSAHWKAIRATPHRSSPSQEGDSRTMTQSLRKIGIRRRDPEDLSAYGLVCLLMERCSSISATHYRPSCLLLTVCRFQWVLRHLPSKLFLLTMSVVTLTVNTGIVFAAKHELEVPVFTDCFNTWKSPQDFSYKSLAMNHASLSMIIPSMSCLVAYFCLRMLVSRQRAGSLVSGCSQHRNANAQRQCQQGCCVTHSRWIHLGFADSNGSSNQPPGVPTSGPLQRPLNACTASAPVGMMSVDDVPDDDSGSSFLDRLYAMIKSREFVLSIVYVEDGRLAAEPPQDLRQGLNAIASITALFFVLLIQPQILLLAVGCLLGNSMDWSLMKNMGLATDLIANNRISFTLFLYLFVGGKRISNGLLQFLEHLYACSCPCFFRRPARSESRAQPASRFSPRGLPAPTEVSVIRTAGQGHGGDCPHRCGAAAAQMGQGHLGQVHPSLGEAVVPKISIMTPC